MQRFSIRLLFQSRSMYWRVTRFCALGFCCIPVLSAQVQYEKTFATYLGGSGYEVNGGVTTDRNGDLYLCGSTTSPDFPVLNSMQDFTGGNFPGSDGFVTKLSPDGELLYSTFIGGSGEELVTDIAVDSRGAIIIAGATTSPDFPLVDALQGYQGAPLFGSDAFVAVISPDGNQIEFSTLFGGTSEETVNGIAVDSNGNIYLAGTTNSFDYKTSANAFQSKFSGRGTAGTDIFVVKLQRDIGDATYSIGYNTLLGGSLDEQSADVAVDQEGRCFLTGYTNSPDFPLRDAVQAEPRSAVLGNEAFIASFSPDGQALYFSSYFGGGAPDNGVKLSVGSDGAVTVLGNTESDDLNVTQDAFQSEYSGSSDVFVTRLASHENFWENAYTTYIGGAGEEFGTSFAQTSNSTLMTVGVSVDQSLSGAFPFNVDESGGMGDAYFLEWSPGTDTVIYAHVIGGSGLESMVRMATSDEIVAVTGTTQSDDFPVLNALQPEIADAGGPVLTTDLFVLSFTREVMTSVHSPVYRDIRFDVRPNPARDRIIMDIRIPTNVPARILLIDMFGNEVTTLLDVRNHGPVVRLEHSVGHLPDGAYICHLYAGAVSAQKMLVIHHD